MKKGFLILLLVTSIASCKMAMFNQLVGVEQTVFPDTLQGNYYLKVPTGWFKKPDTDTLYFAFKATSYEVRDSSESTSTQLDADHKLVLLKKRYYALANHHDEYKSYWTYMFIEQSKKGLKCYSVLEDDKSKTLPKYFGKKFVQVNNAGDSVFVYQASEMQLVSYFEKVLKKKDALELVRIKK